MLACVPRGVNFPFNAALPESARDQDAGYIFEPLIDAIHEGFSIDEFEIDSAIFTRGAVRQRFVDALIRITNIDIFADDRDVNASARIDDAFDEFSPVIQLRFRRFKMQEITYQLVDSLGMQGQRNLVNRVLNVALLDHRFFRNAAEQRQLSTDIVIERFFGAANQHLRLQADLSQLCHALLSRLGF